MISEHELPKPDAVFEPVLESAAACQRAIDEYISAGKARRTGPFPLAILRLPDTPAAGSVGILVCRPTDEQ
jgi:hypothetical protein